MRPLEQLRLRALSQLRLVPAVERFLANPWGARVQRLGAHALKRVAARFPVLAELVGLRREAGQHQVAMGSVARRETSPIVDGELTPGVEAHPRAGEQEREAQERALERLMRDPAWETRAQAAADPALRAAPGAVEALLGALADPSAEVAAAAVLSLSLLDDGRVRPALERVLANAEGYYSPVTRAAAVQGLARALPGSERLVLEALGDVDAEVSLAAIAGLAEHAPSRAAAHILPLLEDRSGYFLPFVRLSAVHALSRAGALSRELAESLARRESDAAVRSALEGALAVG